MLRIINFERYNMALIQLMFLGCSKHSKHSVTIKLLQTILLCKYVYYTKIPKGTHSLNQIDFQNIKINVTIQHKCLLHDNINSIHIENSKL